MTLVHLGLDLAGVTTRATMAKGLELAFDRLGLDVVQRASRAPLPTWVSGVDGNNI
jgi:hypothetical protein